MKTVVITGSSRGIGLATAQLFLDKGWRVIGTFNKTAIPLQHKNLIRVRLDLSQPKDIAGTAKSITEHSSHIDALINNAGVALDQKSEGIDIDVIRKTFEVNLFNLVDLTQRLVPLMAKGAHVINIDSNYGAQSLPIDDDTHVGYRLSKAALNMYTRILAFHLKGQGVIISSLDPGWVRTDMGYEAGDDVFQPDREADEVAQDIYDIVQTVKESGFFWRFGQKREW
ncbi:MAG TPA: SDR family NAD(P)-dependent oxidoreductase [Candidatus Saccharimonadales bacterium]|nr:SDR family NAD(P)-dependent oxidoreductase [Candidatus Saccharimonadales bacterium]